MSDGANVVNAEIAKKFLAKDDEAEAELIGLQMKYMQDCREVREQQKTNFKMAVAEGLPKDAWRFELKMHRMRMRFSRQMQNALEDEERDVVETAAMIREAIGEDLASLPLGLWAVGRADETDATAGDAKPKPRRGRPRKDSAVADPAPGVSGDVLATFIGGGFDDAPAPTGDDDAAPAGFH